MRKIPRCFLIIAVFLSVTYFHAVGHGQYLTGPVASGVGGAGRASVEDGEQMLLNPASMAHGSTFASSLFYADGYTDEREHDKWLGLSIADNSENLVCAGGYVFAQRRRTFANLPSMDQQYHQATCGRFVYAHLAVGASIYYLKSEIEDDKDYDDIDGNVGLHYNPTAELGLALVAYNVGSRDRKAPLIVQNLDKVAIGAHYIMMEFFRGRVDISKQMQENPDGKMQYQFGFESKLGHFFIARMGWDADGLAERDYLTAGFSFDGPRLKIDYFYRHNQDYSGGSLHGVDMRMPFW